MRLVYEDSGDEVKVGDKVHLRDGEVAVVTYFRPPTSPASSGKVSLRVANSSFDCEFYVSVIGAKWIEREDRGEEPKPVSKLVQSQKQSNLKTLFEENHRVKRAVEQYYEEVGADMPKKMTILEVLDAYLKWEGILGFTEDITDIFDMVKD